MFPAGVAVCLPDLRGTGETAPEADWQNNGENVAEMEVALGNTLLGARATVPDFSFPTRSSPASAW